MKIQSLALIVGLNILSISFSMLSAATYDEVMQENIDKLYKAKTPSELTNISLMFYRVAQKEQVKWLPLYYAAYSKVRIAFFIKDEDEIDRHLDVAQGYMNKLLKINPQESEIYVLQALIYSMRITGPARGMKYSGLSNGSLEKAEKLNSDNPRVFYCKGNNLYHTPSFFGGGKDKAKPFLEKAAKLFENDKTNVSFWPSWGKIHNAQILKGCNE